MEISYFTQHIHIYEPTHFIVKLIVNIQTILMHPTINKQ